MKITQSKLGKSLCSGLLGLSLVMPVISAEEENMNELWGENVVKMRAENATRGQLFDEGNYAMFIHWGLYSQLGNKVNGKTYYGIGEWIMNKNMADISIADYKELAKTFDPKSFDAKAIVQLAKDAGMKYIVITSKHHDGFAMYDSKACDFNITQMTPWKVDPMKELSEECKKAGLGFGFYYSHNQDWTYPGGGKGPTVDADGKPATFDDYFKKKCLPQVEEITSQYGPIAIVWFDTPGNMPKHYVQQLVDVVRKNQPDALVSGRAGHGLGDYQTLGDMEVPNKNVEGMWESVDTTNDSWAYAWYDEYWKSPKEILHRLIACVGRGGTYMLNIGPDGKGAVPERAQTALREAGEWIRRYPQVVYSTQASPWGHTLPWGDITTKGDKLYLSVFEWPRSGKLYLPGLENEVVSATLLNGKERSVITSQKEGSWTSFNLPATAPEKLVSVIEVQLKGAPKAKQTFGLDPEIKTTILAEFGEVVGSLEHKQQRWMEKFGEWKAAERFTKWTEDSKATFEVEVLEAGDYYVSLTYSGEGRLVWGVEVEGGEKIQNQQNSSHNYQEFPIGLLNFPKAGHYKVAVSCLEGTLDTASLKSIHFELGSPEKK